MRHPVLRRALLFGSAAPLLALAPRPIALTVRPSLLHTQTIPVITTRARTRPETPGAQLWLKRYNGPAGGSDDAFSLGVSPDGTKVFVTGVSVGSSSGNDYATIAYSASTGTKLWVKRYDGPGNNDDRANSVEVSPDGTRVFVTGFSIGSSGRYDYATIAYDASTGAELWVKRYNGPGDGNDVANSVGVSPDGGEVFVTGGSPGVGSISDYATIAYDASTGAKLWVKRYTGSGPGAYDQANSLAVSPDGGEVFVTGFSVGSGDDFATIAYCASTGARLWVKRYNGPGNAEDVANSVEVSLDGGEVFVTGFSTGSSSGHDYATIAYDASTGAQSWVKRYNGPGNAEDLASSVGVTPDGTKVFVTGESTGSSNNYDYATIAYDASTGAPLWVKRYNSPGDGNDVANSLGVSPDGSKVVVTGESYGTFDDYVTIAYSTS